MSQSLFSRAVDIISEGIPPDDNKTAKKASKTGKKRSVEERLQHNASKKKLKIEQIRKEILESKKKENINDNVIKLLRFGKKCDKMDKKTIERVYAKRYVSEPEKKKEEEQSIFTEEDFQSFERDYFPDF